MKKLLLLWALAPLALERPRWMGSVPLASSDATPIGSNNGSAMNVDGGGPTSRWQQHWPPKTQMWLLQRM
jgi:hypothetical protein